MFPVFVRGEAYLAAHKGSEAAAEFHAAVSHGDGDGDAFSLGEPIVDRAGARSDRRARPEGALDHQKPAQR